MTRPEPLRTAGLIAAGAATLALVTGCGGPTTAEAKSTALSYWTATFDGDTSTRCSLMVRGQGTDRQHCLDTGLPAATGTNGTPTVNRVLPWGKDEKVVVLVVNLKANPVPQGYAVELVPNGKTWLVSHDGFMAGDPSQDANVAGALS